MNRKRGVRREVDLVHLFLRKTDGPIELVIEDKGLGFDLEDTFSVERGRRGLGLTSMKERTGLSAGSFAIQSLKGTEPLSGCHGLCNSKRRSQPVD